jgi:hypothetical protein
MTSPQLFENTTALLQVKVSKYGAKGEMINPLDENSLGHRAS